MIDCHLPLLDILYQREIAVLRDSSLSGPSFWHVESPARVLHVDK